jgi:hypothetical protein
MDGRQLISFQSILRQDVRLVSSALTPYFNYSEKSSDKRLLIFIGVQINRC